MDNTETPLTPSRMVYTQKQIKKILMPIVGTILEGQYKVTYVNLGKLRFTGTYGGKAPELYSDIEQEDKVYTVGHVNESKRSFTATLSNVVQQAPESIQTNEVTKME